MRVSNIKREKEFEFPVLLENQRSGLIVLAVDWHGPKKQTFAGVCIRVGDSDNKLGEHKKYWATEAFTLFKGSLTLEQ